MEGLPPGLQQTAWLFTRGQQSVRMDIEPHDDGTRLLIRGPGAAVAAYDFPEIGELVAFQQERELDLVEGGFQLQAVVERRAGRERRQPTKRELTDRRRT